MTLDANLFWFGSILELALVMVVLKLLGFGPRGKDGSVASPAAPEARVREWQQQILHLTQECLQQQNELQQRDIQAAQLTQECLRLQQQLQQSDANVAQLNEASARQQNESQHHQAQMEQLTHECLRLQHRLQEHQLQEHQLQEQAAYTEQTEQLSQECLQLRQQLEQQAASLTQDLHHAVFKQLQTLMVNHPSVSKLAQTKPNLPAKNLVSILTPLDNLLHHWGYAAIGSVWEQVPYDPTLHQPDAADIAPGELVYIRFVGYRDGEHILCPAKVSRTLPGNVKQS